LISTHTETNMEVIKKFMPIDFVTEQQGSHFRVTCQSA
jgi:RNA 3'-terminal phosphate cyclase